MMSVAQDLSKIGLAVDPPHVDLSKLIASNANQMSNGQEKASEAKIVFYQDEGSRPTQTGNNNNDSRSFRKSQSALALTSLPEVRVGDCTTCEEDSDNSEILRSTQLKNELKKLQEALMQKELECLNLTHVQLQTGMEVEELTASLFEEANKMVQDANIKRMATEKNLIEANSRIEVLQAEVTALKALVLTSTPSTPNPHLNPQIDKTKKTEVRGHRRSTSHHSFIKEIQLPKFNLHNEVRTMEQPKPVEESEPESMKDFRLWRQSPDLNVSSPFLLHIINEDVLPCLNFANVELSKRVFDGILSNTVSVEPLVSQKMIDCQHCALSDKQTVCAYCFKLGDLQTPFAISKMVRNRIIAVCDFVTYMRYIMQGLVKSSEKEMFGELLQLRKKMCLARLGLEE
jgi:Rab-3A-interacting protein